MVEGEISVHDRLGDPCRFTAGGGGGAARDDGGEILVMGDSEGATIECAFERAGDVKLVERENGAGVGIVPGWGGTQRLLRLLPEPMVKEMALFGNRIKAGRALACGFAAAVDEDPRAAAFALLERAVTLSPRAVDISKSMIHAAQDEDKAAMIEALGSAAIAATDDRAEGVAAFRDKRTPHFSGK